MSLGAVFGNMFGGFWFLVMALEIPQAWFISAIFSGIFFSFMIYGLILWIEEQKGDGE